MLWPTVCSVAMGQGCDIDVPGQSIHVSYRTDGGHNEHVVVEGPEKSKYFHTQIKKKEVIYYDVENMKLVYIFMTDHENK